MDSSLSRVSPELINKLSDKDKQELQQFIMQESQKATIQNCASLLPSPNPERRISHKNPFSPFAAETRLLELTHSAAIHSLTDLCFNKCITSKISAGKLDRSEEPCMQNCVDRFMDANNIVLKNLESMRGA